MRFDAVFAQFLNELRKWNFGDAGVTEIKVTPKLFSAIRSQVASRVKFNRVKLGEAAPIPDEGRIVIFGIPVVMDCSKETKEIAERETKEY